MKSFSFSGLKWKIDTGSGAPTKEEVEREVAVLCLCPRFFPEAYFPKWRAAECSGNVLEGALYYLLQTFCIYFDLNSRSFSPLALQLRIEIPIFVAVEKLAAIDFIFLA